MNKDDIIHGEGYTITRGELYERVRMEDDDIMVVREISHGTVDTVTVLLDAALELEAKLGRYAMVIDLTETQIRPKGAYKEKVFEMLSMKASHFSFVLPGNMVVRTVVRYLMSRMVANTSVHKEFSGALEAARTALKESA